MRIVLTGGGTGGHIFPLVAVSRKINELVKEGNLGEVEFYYLGPSLFLESSLEREELNFHYSILITGKWRRYASIKNFIDIFKIGAGFIQALWKLLVIMPDVIFSKGGYGSVATVLAGWFYRIPIILHESDSVPGLANRLMSPFATFIAVSWNEAAKHFPENKTYFTGEAVRDGFFEQPREKEKILLHLTEKKPTILVLGGSQGAQKINDIILDILPNLLEISEIIHQIGDENYNSVFNESRIILKEIDSEKAALYHPVNFMVEPEYIAAIHYADLVISRSGAGSIFEIAASGKASILIPITNSPNDHARRNAYIFSNEGERAEIIEEKNLTPNLFLSIISGIINDSEKREKMKEHAKEFATPNAAKLIAQALINLIPR